MLKRGLGMDKKGQDITIGTLILIVLGLVVLVLLIVGFTVGWDFIISKFRIAPGQTLEAVAQSCKFSGQNNLKIDYCGFKELKIEGKKQFINCRDSRIENVIKGDLDITPATFCQGFDEPKDYCEKKGLKKDALVNNGECEQGWSAYINPDTGRAEPIVGVSCTNVGVEKPIDNTKTSTEWRDTQTSPCDKTGPNDPNTYSIVTSEVTDNRDKPSVTHVCCLITTP